MTISGVRYPRESLTRGPLRLRRWNSSDQALVHRLVNESLPHLRPWMPWATNDYDLAAAAEFLAQVQNGWAQGYSYSYAVIEGDTTIGSCGMERRIGQGGMEIGYWLHPAHTGGGLATEAAAALVDEAFTLPDIERVQIWYDAANLRSGGVPRRLGFTEIDRLTPPRDPLTPGEVGVDVITELTRRDAGR